MPTTTPDTSTEPTADTGTPITRLTPLHALPQMLRVDEAAAWLDVGRGLVFDLCRRGDLRSVRLGRLVRIPREALAAWVEGKRRG
jgi:excisionase family DNA binding protein